MAERILIRLHDIDEAKSSDVLLIDSIIDGGPTAALTFTDIFTNSGVPVTLNQLFSSGVTLWTALTDTPGTILANQFVVGNPSGTDLIFTPAAPGTTYDSLTDTPASKVIDNIPFVNAAGTDHIYQTDVRGDQVKTAEPATSGILEQLDGDLTFVDATDLTVASGSVRLIERVTPTHTREHPATWGTQNITVPGGVLSDPFGVVVLEDVGFTGTATPVVVSFATATPDYLSERTRLGYTVHQAGALVAVMQSPEVYKDAIRSVEEIWRTIGITKLAGTGIHQEIAATLTSSVTASIFTGRNINFRNDPDNAHEFTFAAEALMAFDETANDGTVFATASTSFPAFFNSSGTKTALTGQRAVVHQVYHLPGVGDFCQLGTTNYQNFDTATQSLIAESVNNPLPQTALVFGIRHSFVVVAAGVTQWADGNAHIFPIIGTGGATSGGVTKWTGLTDTDNDYVGKAGFSPVVNVGETALVLQAAAGGALNVASLELEHSTDIIAVPTSPVLVVYDIVNDGDINGFFSYSAGVLTCLIACRVLILPRLDSTVNSGSSRSGIRLDIRLTDVSVQVFDNNSRSDTVDAPDTQNNASANIVCAISDTLKIYINSYVTGLSDVWEGANRLQLVILKDLT